MHNQLTKIRNSHRKGLVVILCSLGLSLVVASSSHAAGWAVASDVLYVQAYDTAVYVRLDSTVVANVNNCSNWGGWFILYNAATSMNDFDRAKLSVALAALSSGKKVTVYSGGLYC